MFKSFVKTVLFMMAIVVIVITSKGTAFAQDLKVRQCDEWRCESILESSKRILSYEDSYYVLMDQYIRFSEDGESYIWYMKVYNKDLNTIEEYVDELEFVEVGRISDILAYH